MVDTEQPGARDTRVVIAEDTVSRGTGLHQETSRMDDRDRHSDASTRDQSSGQPSAEHLGDLLDRLDALWLAARRQGVTRVHPTKLGSEVREVAVAARASGVRPEQFLWIIKETWTSLPEVRTAPDPEKVHDQLSSIITLCIHEYYRE